MTEGTTSCEMKEELQYDSGIQMHNQEFGMTKNLDCLVCRRQINRDCEPSISIYNSHTSHSRTQVAQALVTVVFEDTRLVEDFTTTTLCLQCYSLIDQADSFYQQYLAIKKQLKSLMCSVASKAKLNKPSPAIKSDSSESRKKVKKEKVVKESKIKLPVQNQFELSVHSHEYFSTENFTCLFCFEKFNESASLAEHFDIQHKKKATIECLECQKDIRGGFEKFTMHVSSKHSSYEANQCMGEIKSRDTSLIKTKDFDTVDSVARKLRCVKCDVVVTEENYERHVRQYHRSRSRLINCTLCGHPLRKDQLKPHLLQKHNIGEPLSCPDCPEQFIKPYSLKIHRERVHMITSPAKSFPCPDCGKSFLSQYRERLHYRLVHESVRPYVCEVCGMAFKMKNVLTSHLRKHTGVRPYVCQICSKAFNRVTDCKKHIRKVHNVECSVRFNDAIIPNNLPIKVITSSV